MLSRLLVLACVLLVAGSLAATAADAKAPYQAVVCGQTRCLTFGERTEMMSRIVDLGQELFYLTGPPRPAPFYKVTIGGHYPWSFLYVPSRRLMRITSSPATGGYWRTAPPTIVGAFKTLSPRLRPYPASARWRAP